MAFWERLSLEQIRLVAVPVVVAAVIIVVALWLRRLLYKKLHTWAARTETRWDDLVVRETRLASLVWCFWLGIYGGMLVAELPSTVATGTSMAAPVLFVSLGIYTAVALIELVLAWYSAEIAPKTKSSLDDMIVMALRWGVPMVAGILGLILVLDMVGIEMPAVGSWLRQHGGKLAFLIVLNVVALLMTTSAIPKIITSAVSRSKAEQTEEELKKRAETLSGVLTTSLQVLIMLVFAFMLLSEVGINIAPVLAGLGIAGIAIGFGAQSLVKDIIAGLFIILENQYGKGDVVKIADVAGLVEDINFRRTVLRDLDGIVHVIPNGEIRVASNFTKEWSRVNLNISVAYDTDLDRAIAVINRVGQELASDPQWAAAILTPPRALRVDNLGDSGIEIKILGETKPIRQWDVMGELRLRLKKAFDAEGIEIPWPHIKLYFGNTPPRQHKSDSN